MWKIPKGLVFLKWESQEKNGGRGEKRQTIPRKNG